MVTVNNIYTNVSKNGLGNRLFQYCWAREIAEYKNYKLICEPIKGFPITYSTLDGKECRHNILVTPPATQIFNLDQIFNHDGGIVVYGNPQRYEHYIKNKKKIKEWMYIENEENYETPHPDDLIINVRLGDYVPLKWDLEMDYYASILKREKFRNAIIICDDPHDNKLNTLKDLGCQIKDNSNYGELKFISDFVYVKHAKKCIIANSTFSWWAAFLGTGKIYFPCLKFPWISNPTLNDVDLRVYDEKRYEFIYEY